MSETPGFGRSWLLSFADLTSLLLAFFLMLYASGHMGADAWKRVQHSLSEQFKPGNHGVGAVGAYVPLSRSAIFGADAEYLRGVMAMRVAGDPDLANVRVERRPGGVAVPLGPEMFVDSGAVTFTAKARDKLAALSNHLQYFRNRVEIRAVAEPAEGVEGWTLPVTRAIAVANELKRQGYPNPVASIGYIGTPALEIFVHEEKR